MSYIEIESPEEASLKQALEPKTDPDSMRLKRFLALPDLSRTEGSPLKEIVDRTLKVEAFHNFDIIKIPEIIPTNILFDLFNMPEGHPARSKSDTYYVDEKHVLRTHNTVSWYYYLNHPEIKERIERKESFGALCHGKVYRKDEIDSRHMNVFHQIDGWYLTPDSSDLGPEDLKEALGGIVKTVFGPEQVYRINEDNFPYTDPSFEVEVNVKGTAAEGPAKGEWLEILGSGMIRKSVLEDMGIRGYKGWAFGFGIERLAIISMSLPDIRLLWSEDERVRKQLNLGQKYKEVSKFPPVIRDISFVVSNDFVLNDYFDRIRDLGGELIEQVEQTDKYENKAKFGEGKTSYTFRITYRSLERTLTNAEVNQLHEEVEKMTETDFGAKIRLA